MAKRKRPRTKRFERKPLQAGFLDDVVTEWHFDPNKTPVGTKVYLTSQDFIGIYRGWSEDGAYLLFDPIYENIRLGPHEQRFNEMLADMVVASIKRDRGELDS
jgi:hypothetical protein